MAIAVFTFFLFSITHARPNPNTDTLKVIWYGSHEVLSSQALFTFVPTEMVEFTFEGKTERESRIFAYVVPAQDSAGSLSVDTISVLPQYLLVLYGTNRSVLRILKHSGGGYDAIWTSNKLDGSMGKVSLRDLNSDGTNEIVVGLAVGMLLRENTFLYSWDGDSPKSLQPSGSDSGQSEFSLSVQMIESDTGLTIKTIRSGKENTYFYGKNSSEIRLISEAPVASKK